MARLICALISTLICFTVSQDCHERDYLDLSSGQLDLQFFLGIRDKLIGGCRKIDAKYGMMRLEAFLYAIDLLNANKSLSKGFTYGSFIHDTCGNPNKEIICSVGASDMVIGLIGPEESNAANIASVIYSSFTPSTPVITYGGTSDFLQDNQDYFNLFHTVPGDDYMVDALTDVASFYNWTYIGVLYSVSNIGHGFAEFKAAAIRKGVCIKFSAALKKDLSDTFFDRTLEPLKAQKRLQVVFLLLTDIAAKKLFNHISRNYQQYLHLNFVGGQQLGTKLSILSGNNLLDVGLLTLEVESPRVPGFENYYLGLRPTTNLRNAHFRMFWEQLFNCSLSPVNASVDADMRQCHGNETLAEGKGFFENAPVMPIINAVLSIGQAMKLHLEENKLTVAALANYTLRSFFKTAVLQKLKLIKLPSSKAHHLQFDTKNRLQLNYTLYNTQLIDGRIAFKNVGAWNKNGSGGPKSRLFVDESLVKWRLNKTPTSMCGYVCRKNEIKVYDKVFPCCWECSPCLENSIIINNTCKVCTQWTRSDDDANKCLPMPLQLIDTESTFPVIIIILVTCLVFSVLVIMLLYIKYFHCRAIKATNRELSFVSLLGLVIMFLTPLAFLTKPTALICNLQQCLFGTSLALCSVPLFLKALVLFRIVTKAKTSVTTPKLSTKRSQMFICIGLVSIQLLLCALWIQGNPSTAEIYASADNKHMITHCKFDLISLSINFIYPCILLLLAVAFVLRTRSKNLPAGVDEGKRIALTSALTCFILFLYVVSFTMYVNDKKLFVQEYSISFIYLIIGAINVCCIFCPRLVILLRSNTNVEDGQHLEHRIIADGGRSSKSTPVAQTLAALDINSTPNEEKNTGIRVVKPFVS